MEQRPLHPVLPTAVSKRGRLGSINVFATGTPKREQRFLPEASEVLNGDFNRDARNRPRPLHGPPWRNIQHQRG